MTSLNKNFILKLTFIFFFTIFASLSFKTMLDTPFYDFDEAHRAENAKRMREYKSFFVPLTGSSQDRVEHLKIPFKENNDFYLYYHLERPPLVYDLMILSTSIFGNFEWAYRLVSFLLGVITFVVFLLFAKKEEKPNIFALSTGLLVLFTSSDLWLSSQYAQMDTGITLFLFLSLLTLILFVQTKKNYLAVFSGIFFGLGVLSKLQPAVIFAFPLIYLLIIKKINKTDLLKFAAGFLLIFMPWVIYLIFKFGLKDVISIMPGFALTSASIIDIHQKAPIFWYVRWWWESLRPGWTIFLALFFYEILSGNLNWKKVTLLSFIFGGLTAFSIPVNKIWWYVLPLVPPIAFYIFLATKDYLEQKPNRLVNLSFAILIASLPIFLRVSNTLSLIYGILVTLVIILILLDKLTLKVKFHLNKKSLFYICLILSLLLFQIQFPKIIPYHWNIKPVAQFYKNLPYPKCLWLGDIPGEAVLFYSEAGEVPILNKNSQIFSACQNNYLITSERYKEGELILRQGSIRLYRL